jgi:DNA-binding transcriptional MerR regulator
METPTTGVRIGEFARRVGFSAELLRAWERRYGLLRPVRTAGGFRLYSADDELRVARMRMLLEQGLSPAEAAHAAQRDEAPAATPPEDAAARLLAAIRGYDEAEANAVIDDTLAAFGLDRLVGDVLMPALRSVGDEWESGRLAIAQEHFASNLIRGRLLALSRSWGRGVGPLALLACAEGETHDIALIAFGLVLRSHGWRIVFLGADTPAETLDDAVERTRPALTVVAAVDPSRLEQVADDLAAVAARGPLALAGPGATDELSARIGARRLDADVLEAASAVAA